MPFEKGESGNVKGRPKGVKDRRSIFRELVEPHKDKLMQKAVDMALSGNEQMLRLLLDRMLPVKPRDEPLPKIGGLDGDIAEQCNKIISLVADGIITPADGNSLMNLLSTKIQITDVADMKRRLTDITNILEKRESRYEKHKHGKNTKAI